MQPKVLSEELCVAIGKLVVAPEPRIGTGIWNAIEPVVMISRSRLKDRKTPFQWRPLLAFVAPTCITNKLKYRHQAT